VPFAAFFGAAYQQKTAAHAISRSDAPITSSSGHSAAAMMAQRRLGDLCDPGRRRPFQFPHVALNLAAR